MHPGTLIAFENELTKIAMTPDEVKEYVQGNIDHYKSRGLPIPASIQQQMGHAGMKASPGHAMALQNPAQAKSLAAPTKAMSKSIVGTPTANMRAATAVKPSAKATTAVARSVSKLKGGKGNVGKALVGGGAALLGGLAAKSMSHRGVDQNY